MKAFLMYPILLFVQLLISLPASSATRYERCAAHLLAASNFYLGAGDRSAVSTEALKRLKDFREWTLLNQSSDLAANTATVSVDSDHLNPKINAKLAGRIRGIEMSAAQSEGEDPSQEILTRIVTITGADEILNFEREIDEQSDEFSHMAFEHHKRAGIAGLAFVALFGRFNPNFHATLNDPLLFLKYISAFYSLTLISGLDHYVYRFFQVDHFRSVRKKNLVERLQRIRNGEDLWFYEGSNFKLNSKVVDSMVNQGAVRSHDMYRQAVSKAIPLLPGLVALPSLVLEKSVWKNLVNRWVGLDRFLDRDEDGQPRLTIIVRASRSRPPFKATQKNSETVPNALPESS